MVSRGGTYLPDEPYIFDMIDLYRNNGGCLTKIEENVLVLHPPLDDPDSRLRTFIVTRLENGCFTLRSYKRCPKRILEVLLENDKRRKRTDS